MRVGDVTSDARGSGARDNGGKPEFDLIPLHLLAGVARVLMSGSIKYAPYNWAKGMDWSHCYNSLLRHLFAFWYLGEEYDAESGEHHLSHVVCNALFLLHYIQTHKDGDDRPRQELTLFVESTQEFRRLFDP